MVEVYRATREVEVDESDLISLADAARELNKRLPSVANLVDRGVLPWFEVAALPGVSGARSQRYTSRSAVMALKVHRRRATGKPKA